MRRSLPFARSLSNGPELRFRWTQTCPNDQLDVYGQPEASTLRVVGSSVVYRTGPGMIFRVTETDEGGLKVDVLKDGAWVPGRIGMVGLRLASSTTALGASATRELPV
jgi:hypothetical protein